MRATPVALQTLVLAALVHRFVLEFRTIGLLVAHLGQRDAHATAAVELCLRVALGYRSFRCRTNS